MRRRSGSSLEATALVLRLGLLALLIVLWEINFEQKWVNPFFVSRPSAILKRVATWFATGEIWRHLGVTLEETVLGYVAGVIVGLLLAFLLYRYPLLDRVLTPYLAVLNGIPRIILAPLFILWFGLKLLSKVMLIVTVISLIVFFAVYSGLKEVDQNLIHRVRLLGGQERDVLVHVLIPSALSWVFSSLRLSIGFALVGAIVAEYVGSARGVGHLIQQSEGMLDSTGVFAGLFLVSALVLALDALLRRVENRLTAWRLD